MYMSDGVVFIDLSYELLVAMFQLCAVGLQQATLSINQPALPRRHESLGKISLLNQAEKADR